MSLVRTFFILDTSTGVIHLFKNPLQGKPSRSLSAFMGKFPDQQRIISDPKTGEMIPSFQFQLRKRQGRPLTQFTVIAENLCSIDILREAFEISIRIPPPKVEYEKIIGQSALTLARMPWQIISLVVVSLEKIGDGARATPHVLTGQRIPKDFKKIRGPVPTNMVSGLAYGGKSMVEHLVSAVAGVVLEPVNGAKKGGFKGGALGFGKGILGLICKPVAGTIDLVTQTTRGIGNTPMTMYVGLSKLIRVRQRRRKPRDHIYPPIKPYIPTDEEIKDQERRRGRSRKKMRQMKKKGEKPNKFKNPNEDSEQINSQEIQQDSLEDEKNQQIDSYYDDESDDGSRDPDDEIYLGEEQDKEYYISRKALQQHILNQWDINSKLPNDEEAYFGEEQEKQKMKEIIIKQRILLQNREDQILKQMDTTSQIKNITVDLLQKLNQQQQLNLQQQSLSPTTAQQQFGFQQMSKNCYSMYSGDTGFREIETIGLPSQADEKDLEKGLYDIMNIIEYDQILQKKRSHKRVTSYTQNRGTSRGRRLNDDDILENVDEFDEQEEENYLHNILQQKQLEDENLEVFLIEAQEVKDINHEDEFQDALDKEFGQQSDHDDESFIDDDQEEEEEKVIPILIETPSRKLRGEGFKSAQDQLYRKQKSVIDDDFDPLLPFVKLQKLRSTIKGQGLINKRPSVQFTSPELMKLTQQDGNFDAMHPFGDNQVEDHEIMKHQNPKTLIRQLEIKNLKMNEADGVGDNTDEVIFVRNSKFKMPPSIHDHHKRNAFHREFNRDSILVLEKELQKELLEERIHCNMIVKQKNETQLKKEEEKKRQEEEKQEQLERDKKRQEREELKRKKEEEQKLKERLDQEEKERQLVLLQNDPEYKVRQELYKLIQQFKGLDLSGDYRTPDAFKDGGFGLTDQVILNKYRMVAKELVKSVGKKILSGNFNLTQISFPIKCMQSNSILQIVSSVAMVFPFYLTSAAKATDPVERMKYVIASSVAFIYPTHHFDKPLNPILGETYEGDLPDGTRVFSEQTFHHPPISHVLVEGPEQMYQWSSYSHFSAKAWINSLTLNVYGGKVIRFKDGTVIKYNNQGDAFNNTFFGTLNHQITGKVEFVDEKNKITAFYEIGKVKKKAQDYLKDKILKDRVKVCEIYGNYMGFLDFNGVRYWDLRNQFSYDVVPKPIDKALPSDTRFRIDSKSLLEGDVEQAQKNKETLENLQRKDRKLREAAEKRRSHGGPKIGLPSTS